MSPVPSAETVSPTFSVNEAGSVTIIKNSPAPGVEDFYPINNPRIGTPYSKDTYPQNKTIPKVFQPLQIRNTTFKNRIWSPMCQYSATDGHMTDWHLVHLGGFASRGVGPVMLEATAIVPEGRISPECPGIWSDSQIAPMKRIVDFIHGQGTVVGIQLSHAGRKASTLAPWISAAQKATGNKTMVATEEQNGWPTQVVGPSEIPFGDNYPRPKAMKLEDIDALEKAYMDAVERYERPLFYRVSATDWAEVPEQDTNGEWKSWGIKQTIEFSRRLHVEGVDLVDTSSGGNWSDQKIPVGPMYQVPFAESIKQAIPELIVGSVGLITTPQQAEEILCEGKADVVMLGRELLRHVDFPIYAAQELGVVVKPANQYERAWTRMMKPKD
ncbi:NADH:flavin oxidoreductase/NADH oxidase [Rhizoctonia solani AG-1 IA]|uniref:NADH:flavin oxidoreductase/NADH oxidase n=1 Tax=Thanatephorus cucumeris (strain AG1-IA) TaxID=983506 RepID=L8WZR4_THACA|nr:NADH:flavin oxidoreductase/NADH oxidase [Rhizoctonia solani AG-1 IA]